MGREKGAAVRLYQREHVREREALEMRFEDVIEPDDTLSLLVTGEEAKLEPFHRWHPYRQQFSPGLVRIFLEQSFLAPGPVLDPFSGSATTIVACARNRVPAIGIDGLEVLAHMAKARFLDGIPPLPDLPADGNLSQFFDLVTDPAHRAALLFAAARTVSGDGRPRRTGPHRELLAEVWQEMLEDLARPLPRIATILVGDARAMPLAAESVGGVLTSPPYLSRYDYRRILSPVERLWSEKRPAGAPAQVVATVKSPRKAPRFKTGEIHGAAEEAAAALVTIRRHQDAAVVRAYFHDLGRFVREAWRVMRPHAPLWILIGGADIEREYIPSDLIIAEMGQAAGFVIDGVTQARVLRDSARKLGKIDEIAPRESIVKLRKPGP